MKVTDEMVEAAWDDFEGRPFQPRAYYEKSDMRSAIEAALTATPASAGEPVEVYEPGNWYHAHTIDEMQAFYLSRLSTIREAARRHGYAIGIHGSQRRDFDLIAMQWRDEASDKDVLAHAIAEAACGISRNGPYEWEQKPSGRVATSFPICWTEWHGMISAGHIDLSLIDLAIDT